MLSKHERLMNQRVDKYAPIIMEEFEKQNTPFFLGMAFAYVETKFRSYPNLVGGDGARGGAWGIFQVTLLTARGHGFDGTGEELSSAHTNAKYAAMIIKEAIGSGKSDDYKNIASRYNSGKPYDRAPDSTKNIYVPRFLEAVSWAKGWIELHASV